MAAQSHPEIYFHVGLGKTGTTYLQYRFFNKLKGTHYIQRTSYKQSKDIIAKTGDPLYFVSNEFDQQLEDQVKWFSSTYPDAHTIIVFRRHDSWIASQYRRFVKNGYRKPFETFFDLDNDGGRFVQSDLRFYDKIMILKKYFTQQPLVLFYEDMRIDEFAYMDKIAAFTKSTYDRSDIDLAAKHKSYSEKQLKAMYAMGKYFNLEYRRGFDNIILHWAFRITHNVLRYSTLYAAKVLPESWFGKGSITSPEYLDRIRNHYNDDWEKCKEYARENNPV